MELEEGLHWHSQDRASIEVGEDAMNALADHVKTCKSAPANIDRDTNIPISFTTEGHRKKGRMELHCGYCNTSLGTFQVRVK